jgi:hypothetical protein
VFRTSRWMPQYSGEMGDRAVGLLRQRMARSRSSCGCLRGAAIVVSLSPPAVITRPLRVSPDPVDFTPRRLCLNTAPSM